MRFGLIARSATTPQPRCRIPVTPPARHREILPAIQSSVSEQMRLIGQLMLEARKGAIRDPHEVRDNQAAFKCAKMSES
jgi:hypothetical protein